MPNGCSRRCTTCFALSFARFQPDGGSGDGAIGSEHDAVALAIQAPALLREYRTKHQTRRTHIILHAPSSFCLFLGQRLTALGEIVAYDQRGGSRTAVTLQREGDPPVRLWIDGWAKQTYEGRPTVELDWTARFDPRTRRIPKAEAWPALLAELDATRHRLASLPGGTFVDVRGKMPLSVALAVGWALPAVMFRLRLEQPTKGRPTALWDSHAYASARRFEVVREAATADGEDVLVALSITADTTLAVDRFLEGRSRPFRATVLAAPTGGPGSSRSARTATPSHWWRARSN